MGLQESRYGVRCGIEAGRGKSSVGTSVCPVWDVMSENDPMAVMCEERAGARAAGPIELRAGRPAQLVLRRRGRSRARARAGPTVSQCVPRSPYRTGAVYLYGYAGNAGARSV
jgi:hypothetical protein